MRIVAGEHRSRRLVVPPGRDVRPTSDRAREALFASLGSVAAATALDVFAGSGALGLEALSRGAASCRFVERDERALAAIRENGAARGETGRATIERGDAVRVLRRLAREDARFELVLADPPYADVPGLAPALAELLPRVVAPGGRLVLELPAGAEAMDLGMRERYNRRMGAARIVILQSMEGA
jgi:16S rRNA (guanine966-N2)-methyltransferase